MTIIKKVQGRVSTANNLTEIAIENVALPNDLDALEPAAFPRSLTPLVQMDFAAGLYKQNGQSVTFEELFTYSRNSNATFINRRVSNNESYEYFIDTDFVGNVENLATFSENYEHDDWNKVQSNILINAGRDSGGHDKARKLIGTSSDNLHYVSQAIATAGNINVSVEAKADGYDWVSLQVFGTTANTTAWFNVKTGYVGTQSGAMTNAKIEPLDNGWFRCSATAEQAAGTTFYIILSNDDNTTNFLDNGSDGILISKYQAAYGNKVSPYVKTISASVTETFEELIRQSYDPETDNALGVLIEYSILNLFLKSEECDDANWIKTNSTIEIDGIKAPDKTVSGDKLTASSTSTAFVSMYQTVASNSPFKHTSSFYVKAGEATFAQIAYKDSHVTGSPRANFDLLNGVLGTVDSEIEASISLIGDGWYRISSTVTAADASLETSLTLIQSAADTRFQANSWTAGDGLYVWGSQCEESYLMRSYVYTDTATATKESDELKIPNTSNNPPDGEFSLHAKYKISNIYNPNNVYIYESDTLVGTDSMFATNSAGIAKATRRGVANGSIDTFDNQISSTMVLEQSRVINMYTDGVLSASGVPFIDLEIDYSGFINIGRNSFGSGFRYLSGHIEKMSIYDKALTAEEVAQL